MRRFLSAALFFVALILLWQWLHHKFVVEKGIWSPVLVPTPRQVWDYLALAAEDGTLWHATLVTMRRLLIGYLDRVDRWHSARCSDRALDSLSRHHRHRSLSASRLCQVSAGCRWRCIWFGQTETAMLFVVVMGTLVVGRDRDRNRRAQCSADLSSGRADHGIEAAAHLVEGDPAGCARLSLSAE